MESVMNQYIAIGGKSDKSTISCEFEFINVIKIQHPASLLEVTSLEAPPELGAIKYDTYRKMTVGGVVVYAEISMKPSDVVHTLINTYLKS